jgi:hypothetical protein
VKSNSFTTKTKTMKNIFKIILPAIVTITGFSLQSTLAQSTGANKFLSNLKTPIAVNQSLIAGSNNTLDLGSSAIGWKDLYLTGDIFFKGSRGLHADTSNSAVGLFSLSSNTIGIENSATGAYALTNNTEGSYNTAVGKSALAANLLGNQNTAIGRTSLYSNTVGSYNTAVGYKSLYYNTEGDYNTAIGRYPLYSNTTGNDNTAGGNSALYSNSSGSYNTAFGQGALYSNTSGSYNTSIGRHALYTSTSEYNTAVGYYAGDSYDNAAYNTFLGYDADASSAGHTNSMALGHGARISGGNQVRVGNTSVSSIGGYASWTNYSDGRFKKNVKENVSGLNFINKLRPITYTLDVHGINKFMQVEENADETESIATKEKIVYTGFIAQEVEKSAKEIGYDFSGVDAPKNENDLYGLRYSEFVVPLVKAVQELAKSSDEKDEKIKALQLSIIQLMEAQEKMQQKLAVGTIPEEKLRKSDVSEALTENAFVGQNIPNPFDNSTLIPFRIPLDCHDASIMINEISTGKVIKVIPVSCSETQLQIQAGTFPSGSYSYTLYVDGKMIGSRQMTIIK